MNLSQIASKPQLTKVILDDEEVIKEYSEPLDFYTWDRQPMEVFMKLANMNKVDTASIIEIVKTLILDEKGKQILNEENMLPTNILMKAINKVTEILGK